MHLFDPKIASLTVKGFFFLRRIHLILKVVITDFMFFFYLGGQLGEKSIRIVPFRIKLRGVIRKHWSCVRRSPRNSKNSVLIVAS